MPSVMAGGKETGVERKAEPKISYQGNAHFFPGKKRALRSASGVRLPVLITSGASFLGVGKE